MPFYTWSRIVTGLNLIHGPLTLRMKQRRARRPYFEALEERSLFNAAPVVTGFTRTLAENHTFAFTSADFTSRFFDADVGDSLQSIQIVALPSHGTLMLDATPIVANQTISTAQLSHIVYTPDNDFASADAFSWTGSDGTAFSVKSSRVALTITAPTAANFGVTVAENHPFTFKSANFTGNFTDAATGNTLQSITVVGLPTHGVLTLNASAVTANQTISASDLGSIIYTPANNFTGTDTFSWSARDDAAATNTANITLTVSAPTVSDLTRVVPYNIGLNFSAADFTSHFTDAATTNALSSIQILSLPAHGNLTLSVGTTNTAISVNQIITSGQIANIVYTPDNNYLGGDSFRWTAADDLAQASNSANATLDVAGLLVTGNNTAIFSGDTTPAINDFTDFGFTNVSTGTGGATAGPVLKRIYVVQNITNTPITLSGGTVPVLISGKTAVHFAANTPAAANGTITLQPGDSTTFTITFSPHGAGTGNGLVSIPNSLGSPFTFDIKVQSLKGSRTSDGVVVVRNNPGTGNTRGAQVGDRLTVTYTGFLTGTDTTNTTTPVIQFDQATAASPFSFVLNTPGSAGETVIQGFDEGLAGLRVGETRTLFIPSSLGYGNTTHGNIPPNSFLIFTVTGVAIDRPHLNVLGGGTALDFGDRKPDVADGTDFGTITGTQNSVSHVFTLQNTGKGDLGTVFVTFAGANPGDFSATNTFTDLNGISSTNITVTFKPKASGVRTAFMEVFSNDPDHPLFAVAVQGGIDFRDVALSYNQFTLPGASAANTSVNIPLTVTNLGDIAVDKNTLTDIQIVIHNTSTNADTPLQTFSNLSLGNLGQNDSKNFNFNVTLPADYDPAIDQIVAKLNQNSTITENNQITGTPLTNNVVVAAPDVGVALVSSTIPPQIVQNSTASVNGNVTVLVSNSGNVALPSNEQVSVLIRLHPASGSDIDLTPAQFSVGSLAPGANKTFTVPASLVGIANGTYTIEAIVTPTQGILENSSTNNVSIVTTANKTLTTQASAAAVDLTGTLVSVKPVTAVHGQTAGVKGKLKLTLQNVGNIPFTLGAGQSLQIIIIATNGTASGQTSPILINAGNLSPTDTKTLKVAFSDLNIANLPAGSFTYQAQIVENGGITDSNSTNNLITKTGANGTLPLTLI